MIKLFIIMWTRVTPFLSKLKNKLPKANKKIKNLPEQPQFYSESVKWWCFGSPSVETAAALAISAGAVCPNFPLDF